MTEARFIHGFVALVLAVSFFAINPHKYPIWQKALIVCAALIGSWIPDWDLILGIGFHRSPITHSALSAGALGILFTRIGSRSAAIGVSLGVASHLLWDIVDYGNVIGIPGGDADRLFLLSNAMIIFAATGVVARRMWLQDIGTPVYTCSETEWSDMSTAEEQITREEAPRNSEGGFDRLDRNPF